MIIKVKEQLVRDSYYDSHSEYRKEMVVKTTTIYFLSIPIYTFSRNVKITPPSKE